MSAEPLFEIEDLGDIVVISPVRDMGEFEMADADLPAYQQLLELATDRSVVIDMSRTDYFGSSTVGLFIRLVKQVQSHNRAVAFCNLSLHEQEVVGITHVKELLNVKDSREDAIAFVRNTISKAAAEG